MGRFMDAYKPERHYMRGPGPKWHAKHSASLLTAAGAQPAANEGPALKELRATEVQLLSWMAPMAAAATLGFMAVMMLA